MYEFIDVTDVPQQTLPSEALRLNGEYIENQINGYRTLYVSGRESLAPEIETYETGSRDGSKMNSRKYPARTIVVGYQLLASSPEVFRAAYNKLGFILNVVDAELIFEDESDKFFTGTPFALGEVEPGRCAVTGEIEFLCIDPFKYSITEYEVDPVLDGGSGFVIDYKGTYKSFPILETTFYKEEEVSSDNEQALTGKGDCGYAAFFNENGKIIQLGDPDEMDLEEYPKSQTLTNQSFKNSDSWGTVAKELWKRNDGILVSSSDIAQTGSVGLAHASGSTAEGSYYLKANSYGSSSKYHGPSITRTIPADASGQVGASNFTFSYSQKICLGSGKNDNTQRGTFQAQLISGSGSNRRIVAGINIYKGNDTNRARLCFYVNNRLRKRVDIDISFHNKYFGNNRSENKAKGIEALKTVKSTSITKSGRTITFNAGGVKATISDSDIATTKVTQYVFAFTQYRTKTPLHQNGVYGVKFVKNNCPTWKDIPNKFSTNDVVTANCKSGEILLNNAPAPELGALGNDWENFCLEPGVNQIGTSYSDWVEAPYAPRFKLRYREVFI